VRGPSIFRLKSLRGRRFADRALPELSPTFDARYGTLSVDYDNVCWAILASGAKPQPACECAIVGSNATSRTLRDAETVSPQNRDARVIKPR
jgi:hypothetical protein